MDSGTYGLPEMSKLHIDMCVALIYDIHTNGMYVRRSMARNKYPEETVNKILEVSFQLFVEKGYEATSIQDIIDHLGGLTKGAIYHHFKSKESILLAVYDKIARRASEDMMRIVNDPGMNGMQKLSAMFFDSYRDEERKDFTSSMPNLLDNPRLLALHMKSTMEDVVPKYIYPVLQEGIRDGSIRCEYPMETAHALMVLSNIWMNPLIYSGKEETLEGKIAVFNSILSALGIVGLDDGLKNHIQGVNNKRATH